MNARHTCMLKMLHSEFCKIELPGTTFSLSGLFVARTEVITAKLVKFPVRMFPMNPELEGTQKTIPLK